MVLWRLNTLVFLFFFLITGWATYSLPIQSDQNPTYCDRESLQEGEKIWGG